MLKIVKILLPIAVDTPFDYQVPDGLKVVEGAYVVAPLGRRKIRGVVWGCEASDVDPAKLKPIEEVADVTPMPSRLRDFIDWVADYTLASRGAVLAMAISVPKALEPEEPKIGYHLGEVGDIKLTSGRKRVISSLQQGQTLPIADIAVMAEVSAGVVRGLVRAGVLQAVPLPKAQIKAPVIKSDGVSLSPSQQEMAAILQEKVDKGSYCTTVLDGVTGSGKTEVYFEAIYAALDAGKQVLVLLPEIVLTTQLMGRFKQRFGFSPTPWHSALTPAQRRKSWKNIAEGQTRLVIGARSALFLPYSELGLIVVDEEHEQAFKQEDGVVYHGRDMAVARAHMEEIPIVLVSASPSLETVFNIEQGKFERLHLPYRHGAARMPDVKAVDMRQEKLDAQHWLSEQLKEELANTLARKEQSLLFLNRRGYAPLTLCRTCGYRFQCPDCSAWLVAHRTPPILQCHHCGYATVVPAHCPDCEEEDSFAACGPGVERLEEEVRELLPQARVALMTSDTITNARAAQILVHAIEKGEVDVIVGTQMVAKGHHFPKLTMVGVIDADLGLEGGDLRAAERSFQLLQQVAGRAGREELRGLAIIQSYMPDHVVIQALMKGDRDAFIEGELARRKEAHMPPFSKLAAIVISGKQEQQVQKAVSELAKCLVSLVHKEQAIRVLGPAPAPLLRLRGQYRYRLLVIADRNIHIQKMLRTCLRTLKIPSFIKVKVDIDPYSFV